MNTLRYAIRSLRKQLMFSLINVAGLALGIGCSLLIGMHILDELQFDRFHHHSDRIFRIVTTFSSSDGTNSYSNSATPIAPLLTSEVPEVVAAARMYGREAAIQLENEAGQGAVKKFREANFFFADSSVFNVFTFDFLRSDARNAFKDLNSIVISEEIALKYFGSTDVIGKSIIFEERTVFRVSAVIRNWPDQSHIKIDFLAPFEHFFLVENPETADYLRSDWTYTPVATYILLQQETAPSLVESKLQALVQKHSDDFTKSRVSHQLQPLLSIRLYSNFTGDSGTQIRGLMIIGFVGLLTLLVACFNFINLSVVASLKRAKEAGIKKTLGAGKITLAIQYMAESSLVVLISAFIGFILSYYCLPMLNLITDKAFTGSNLLHPQLLTFLACLLIFIVLIACSYPSLYYSSINPIRTLSGRLSKGPSGGSWLRRSLVVAQLGVSLALLSATFVVRQQMSYIDSAPLGFQKDHMLLVPLFSDNLNNILGGGVDGPLRQRMNSFEESLAKYPDIEASTLSSALPGQGIVSALITTDEVVREDNVFMSLMSVDYDYLEAYKIELLAGRAFSREFGTDHLSAFVINEQALATLGWRTPEEALGKNIEAVGKQGKVVGVIRNYHFQGLREAIRPLVLEVAASKFVTFTIRLRNTDINRSIAAIQSEWDQIFPEKVFEFSFLDSELDTIYRDEQRLGQLVSFFSIISFVISCIGLFGIASYMHLRRTREIGVRKVLGATLPQLFASLSKEFVYLTGAAIIVFSPIAFLVMENWLDDFAYRISLNVLPFCLACVVCGAIVFITIAAQTIRTASIDPVQALKHE